MTDFRLPTWYRWLGTAAKPIAQILSPQRLGPWSEAGPRPVWIHAASLGELKGSIRLVRALPPGTRAFLTSTTAAGLRKLRRELPEHPTALLPLDEAVTIRRFLESIDPRCAIFLESEAWPAALQGLFSRGVPVAFCSFRTGATALVRWRRFGRCFRDWTHAIQTVWTDHPELPESVKHMGFTDIRPGTSLKWAGSIPTTPLPTAPLNAAVSIHLRDLPQLGRLRRAHPEFGWLWFPRRMILRRPLAWFARSLGARVAADPAPLPGEIWIAPEFGMVRKLLPTCHLAWVSAGHDTEEPFHCGVRQVFSGSPASEVAFTIVDTQITLAEILDWIRQTEDQLLLN